MSRFSAKTSFDDDTFWGKLKKAASSDLDIYLAQCEAEIAQLKMHSVKLLQETYIAEKVRAEALQLLANARITIFQGNLLNKIIEDMDFKSITASQALVLVKAINPLASADDVDVAAKDAMIEEELKRMKEENRMLKAQADEEVARATAAKKRHESGT